MKKLNLKKLSYIAVLPALMLLAAVVFIAAYLGSIQSSTALLLPIEFQGEYSYDNGATWTEIRPNTEFSAENKSLLLRGHFPFSISAGESVNFYLDHITMELYKDGEPVINDSRLEIGLIPSTCCIKWSGIELPEITPESELLFWLGNFHGFGNKNAYNDFFTNIYFCNEDIFSSYMIRQGQPVHFIGICVIVVGAMLLAVSAAFRLLRIDGGSPIGSLGLITLFFSIYIGMDSIYLSLWSTNIVVNTYGLNLSIMMAAAAAVFGGVSSLQTGAKKNGNGCRDCCGCGGRGASAAGTDWRNGDIRVRALTRTRKRTTAKAMSG